MAKCNSDDCEMKHCENCGGHMPFAGMNENVCEDCLLGLNETLQDGPVEAQTLSQKSYEERCKRWEENQINDNFVREAYEDKDFEDGLN